MHLRRWPELTRQSTQAAACAKTIRVAQYGCGTAAYLWRAERERDKRRDWRMREDEIPGEFCAPWWKLEVIQ